MSIYDRTIPEDLDDIYSDDDGLWEVHNVDGAEMRAIVHASMLTTRSAIIDMGAFGADKVCIVREADYARPMPGVDSIFFLDGEEYRVSTSSRLGGLCFRIGLRRYTG